MRLMDNLIVHGRLYVATDPDIRLQLTPVQQFLGRATSSPRHRSGLVAVAGTCLISAPSMSYRFGSFFFFLLRFVSYEHTNIFTYMDNAVYACLNGAFFFFSYALRLAITRTQRCACSPSIWTKSRTEVGLFVGRDVCIYMYTRD